MRLYYGAAMAVAVVAAAWMVKHPRSDQAAGVLALSLLALVVPGAQFVAGAFGDSPSTHTWMHLAVAVGPMLMVNLAAAVVAMLAFIDLEKY
jgi:hypothetical protein